MSDYRLNWNDRWLKQYDGGQIDPVCAAPSKVSFSDGQESAVLLMLTPDAFKKLLSAVSIGAELVYPDERQQVIWELLKGVDCAMDFCARVADCIWFSEDVQAALQAWALSQGLLDGAGVPLELKDAFPVGDVSSSCTDSDKYGLCYEVVDRLNQMVEDIFDVLDVYSAQAELVDGLVRAVPVVGQYLGAAADIADFLLSYTHTLYSAAYNSSSHTYVACNLYCEMDGCTLTIGNMRTAFRKKLQSFTPPDAAASLAEFAAWAAGVTTSTDETFVSLVMLMVLEIWVRGAKWLGSGPEVLQVAQAYYSPVDPSGICAACGLSYAWLGGDDSASEWTPYVYAWGTALGVYNSGEDRYEAEWNGDYASGKYATIEYDNTTEQIEVTLVRVTVTVNNTRGGLGELHVYFDGVEQGVGRQPPNGTNTYEWVFDGLTVPDAIEINAAARSWQDEATAYAYIDRIEIETA